MAVSWTIKGEAGKALDATARSLETLKIDIASATLRLGNMEEHVLSCVQQVDSIALVGETVPEEGQEVGLWHDGGSDVRAFQGTLVRRRGSHGPGGSAMAWEVAGPDWWLRQVMLTGESEDQAGNTRDRTSFQLVEGTHAAQLTSILNRAIALGVNKIAVGTIATGFTMPRTTLPNMSCWDALAEILRSLPDAVAWIDYSVVGTPTFNVTRRGTASVISLTVGTGALQSIDAAGQYELNVSGVDLKHVERDSKRRTVYKAQLSGHGGTAQAGSPATSTYTGTATSGGHAGDATALGTSGTITATMFVKDSVKAAAAGTVDTDQVTTLYEGELIKIVSGPGAGQVRRLVSHLGGGNFSIDADWAELPTTSSQFLLGENLFRADGKTEAQLVGNWLKITGGTGAGQSRLIASFDETRDIGAVTEPWDEGEAPDSTSTYVVEARSQLGLAVTGVDDDYVGFIAAIIAGTGSGQRREVVGGDDDLLTVSPQWTTVPDGTSDYSVGPKDTITIAAAQGADTMVGQMIKLTGGTGSGQVRRITARAGDVLTVAPDWTTPPDGTSTYSIGPGTIELAAGASDIDDAYNGLSIEIESGTGSGQTRTIKDYDGANRRALVDSDWTTNPDNTSVYKVGEGSPAFDKQVVGISGPELNAFIPKDEFESETVQSQLISSGASDEVRSAVAVRFDSTLVGINQQWPGIDIDPNTNTGAHPVDSSLDRIIPKAFLENGGEIPAGFRYFLLVGEPRSWWEALGFQTFELRVQGHYKHVKTGGYSPGDPAPQWVLQLQASPKSYTIEATDDEVWYYADFKFLAVNAYWEVPTKLYRQEDYTFINPPEGLAGNLAAAQAFTPFRGQVALEEAEDPYPDHLKKVVNVASGPSEWAAMKAMISSAQYHIGTGRTVLRLGPPARLDFRSLVNRMRRSGDDNIVFIE